MWAGVFIICQARTKQDLSHLKFVCSSALFQIFVKKKGHHHKITVCSSLGFRIALYVGSTQLLLPGGLPKDLYSASAGSGYLKLEGFLVLLFLWFFPFLSCRSCVILPCLKAPFLNYRRVLVFVQEIRSHGVIVMEGPPLQLPRSLSHPSWMLKKVLPNYQQKMSFFVIRIIS